MIKWNLTRRGIDFFVKEGNSIQFKACAVFQLSIDILLVGQTFLYREQTRRDLLEQEEYKTRSQEQVQEEPEG